MKLEIYVCKPSLKKIPSGALSQDLQKESKEVEVTFYEIGKQVGVYQGEITGVYNDAIKYDQSSDPFFGKGKEYIIKSGNDLFVVFFENDSSSKLTQGKRCGIGRLTEVYDEKLFAGSPYEGVTFEAKILSYFKSLEAKSTR